MSIDLYVIADELNKNGYKAVTSNEQIDIVVSSKHNDTDTGYVTAIVDENGTQIYKTVYVETLHGGFIKSRQTYFTDLPKTNKEFIDVLTPYLSTSVCTDFLL